MPFMFLYLSLDERIVLLLMEELLHLISYRVEEPETLVELQRNEWDPVISWAERR